MEFLKSQPNTEGVYRLTPQDNTFEQAYLAVRTQENRLYQDELVRQLPYPPTGHPQAQEWAMRQHNVMRLIANVQAASTGPVLDLGCGNGWLTHRLASATHPVLGLDINLTELLQAQFLFGNNYCHFAYGDVFTADLPLGIFKQITAVSCIQYFPDLSALLKRLLTLLHPGGELHILDSPLYSSVELTAAIERTNEYYAQRNANAMQAHYHHHSWAVLQDFNHHIVYQPNSFKTRLQRKLGRKVSPFAWIKICH